MASRKGFEPLTPGLGNPCSILLSYRDITPRGTYTVLGRNRIGLTPCSESPSSIKSIELGNPCSILLSYRDATFVAYTQLTVCAIVGGCGLGLLDTVGFASDGLSFFQQSQAWVCALKRRLDVRMGGLKVARVYDNRAAAKQPVDPGKVTVCADGLAGMGLLDIYGHIGMLTPARTMQHDFSHRTPGNQLLCCIRGKYTFLRDCQPGTPIPV
jgi:hypothetical protein